MSSGRELQKTYKEKYSNYKTEQHYNIKSKGKERPINSITAVSTKNGRNLKVVYDTPVYNDTSVNGIFKVFVLILIMLAIFSVLSGKTPFSFESLLKSLSELPPVDFSMPSLVNFSISGDWGIFDLFRNFFNLLLDSINIVAWIGKLLYYGIRWLYNLIFILI